MKNLFHLKVAALACLLVFIVSCAKDDVSPWEKYQALKENTDPLGDALNAEDAAIVDARKEAPDYTLHNIILPNGWRADEFLEEAQRIRQDSARHIDERDGGALGPQDQKNELIAKFAQKAIELCDDNRWTGNGQHGLAYSYGSKNHEVLKAPTAGLCTDPVFGLDCSGFIYQIFQHAGLTAMPAGNAETQRDTNTLKNVFSAAFGGANKFRVVDHGQISVDEFQAGDIIYWLRKNGTARHIGIVLLGDDGKLAVYQSNGSDGYDRHGSPVPETECPLNLGSRRGPRKLELLSTDDASWFDGRQGKYGIVRIEVKISGHWKFRLKCTDQIQDAVVHDLDFVDDYQFTVVKKFPDYDGDPLTTTFDFVYDPKQNTLYCKFRTTQDDDSSFYRTDEFTVHLDRDDTGYVEANLIDISTSGCIVDVRLINLE